MRESEARKIRATLEGAVQLLPEQEALTVKTFHPLFSALIGQQVKSGFRLRHNGKLWRVEQPVLTVSEVYPPGPGMESLYSEVVEAHTGQRDDPIPYSGNMELVKGLYYIDCGKTYLCNRDTGAPVHNNLSDLVGIYVEEVTL